MSFYSGTYALSAMWGGKAAVGGATGGASRPLLRNEHSRSLLARRAHASWYVYRASHGVVSSSELSERR